MFDPYLQPYPKMIVRDSSILTIYEVFGLTAFDVASKRQTPKNCLIFLAEKSQGALNYPFEHSPKHPVMS